MGVFVPVSVPAPVAAGLSYDGTPVDNIYPYSRSGALLHDLLFYTGGGRPIDLAVPADVDPDRRVPVTRGGKPIFNAFPIRYYEPGTRRVANPDAGPPVEVPTLATPRLRPTR